MAKKILVTEDSPTMLAIMQTALEDAGYTVVAAADGQQALDMTKKEKPDLIILDLMLPKIDGYKVCAMLKMNQDYAHIPVIIVTARGSDQDKKLGAEVRADAYITKPYQHESVVIKIKELLKE